MDYFEIIESIKAWGGFAWFAWGGMIASVPVIIGIITAAFKRGTIKVSNYECQPLQKSKRGAGFFPVSKSVETLLPGECTEVGTSGSCVIGRTSVKRQHENDNTWYYWKP